MKCECCNINRRSPNHAQLREQYKNFALCFDCNTRFQNHVGYLKLSNRAVDYNKILQILKEILE